MKRKIFFRADAGPHIGYGHFIRSLALADMLKNNFDCYFFTQAPSSYQKEEVAGVCPLIGLPADTRRFPQFLDQLKGDEIVVLDNYFYDDDYKKQIKQKGCTLVCIDDFCHADLFSDAIINYGVKSCDLFQTHTYTKLCLGLDWVLLRAPFLYQEPSVPEKGRDPGHWIVCFGGSDEQDFTGRICAMLEDIPEIVTVTAVTGDSYTFQDTLQRLKKVRMVGNLSACQLADLFCSARYAVLSSSTIALEALSCGTTVMSGYYVQNQKNLYHTLKSDNYIFPLSDLNLLHRQNFIPLIYKCINERHLLKEFTTKHIPERYIRLFALLEAGKPIYIFRDYTELTCEQHLMVWKTRNLEEIRKWMIHQEPFSLDSHLSFVDSLKNTTDKKYWAVFSGSGEFLGSYSLTNIREGSCERGLYLRPECSGKGIAAAMERQADQYLMDMNIKEVFAEVCKENINSVRYHLKQGYKQVREDDAFYYYVKHLSYR